MCLLKSMIADLCSSGDYLFLIISLLHSIALPRCSVRLLWPDCTLSKPPNQVWGGSPIDDPVCWDFPTYYYVVIPSV